MLVECSVLCPITELTDVQLVGILVQVPRPQGVLEQSLGDEVTDELMLFMAADVELIDPDTNEVEHIVAELNTVLLTEGISLKSSTS